MKPSPENIVSGLERVTLGRRGKQTRQQIQDETAARIAEFLERRMLAARRFAEENMPEEADPGALHATLMIIDATLAPMTAAVRGGAWRAETEKPKPKLIVVP